MTFLFLGITHVVADIPIGRINDGAQFHQLRFCFNWVITAQNVSILTRENQSKEIPRSLSNIQFKWKWKRFSSIVLHLRRHEHEVDIEMSHSFFSTHFVSFIALIAFIPRCHLVSSNSSSPLKWPEKRLWPKKIMSSVAEWNEKAGNGFIRAHH